MKKLLILFAMVASGYSVNAQELGMRFGDVVGNDVAVDGIFSSGEFSRIHADLSFGNGVGVEVLWDMIYRPLSEQGFNWYVGVGPTVRFDDPFWFGASGELGLEYHFSNAPIALGLDWRPTLYFVQDFDLSGRGFGFNARYVFGK